MSILRTPSIPLHRDRALRPGLAALVEFMRERNYSAHMIGRAFDFVACHGTLAGSPVEPEDMPDAEAAFVDALPAVPFDAEAWDRTDVYLDAESILEAAERRFPRGGILVPPELEDEYEPTDEDLAEYGHWLEGLDREQVAAMVAPMASITGGAPDEGDDWPRLKTAADRRRDMEDVAEFYATHPGE